MINFLGWVLFASVIAAFICSGVFIAWWVPLIPVFAGMCFVFLGLIVAAIFFIWYSLSMNNSGMG